MSEERAGKFWNVTQDGVYSHPMCGTQKATFVNNRGFVCYTCKNGNDRYRLRRIDQIKLLESQNGKCRLCTKDVKLHNGRPPHSAVIDHLGKPDTPGFKIRGVICHDCNNFLGILDKSDVGPQEFLRNLSQYYL